MASNLSRSSHRKRSSRQDEQRAALTLPTGAKPAAEPPTGPVEQDEIFHLLPDPALEGRLREIHDAVTHVSHGRDTSARALDQGLRTCALCADEPKVVGLPYRIILRCTHGDPP